MNIIELRWLLPSILAILALTWSLLNYLASQKIANNDLVHLEADVKELKEEEKDYKKELNKNLDKIFRRLGKIEKAQGIQRAICDERHGIDK